MMFFLLLISAGLGFALYRTRHQLLKERDRAGARGLGVGAAAVAEDLSDLRARQQIAALQEQLQEAQTDRETARRETTALQQQIRHLEGWVRQADSRVQEIADEKSGLVNENRKLQIRLQEKDTEIRGLNSQVKHLEAEVALVCKARDEYESFLNEITEENGKLINENAVTRERLAQFEQLNSENQSLEIQVSH